MATIPLSGGGYNTSDGKYAPVRPANIYPAATLTATGTGQVFEMGELLGMRLTQTVSAVSGTTPTLDTTVETSDDPTFGTNVRTIGTFTQKTAAGTQRLSFAGCDRYCRVKHTIGGTTPSFTVAVSGEAL
jgi:hypothetical protein